MFTPQYRRGERRKFQVRWTGPWTVRSKLNDVTYVIRPDPSWLRKKEEIVSVDRLKRYYDAEDDLHVPPRADADLTLDGDEHAEDLSSDSDDDLGSDNPPDPRPRRGNLLPPHPHPLPGLAPEQIRRDPDEDRAREPEPIQDANEPQLEWDQFDFQQEPPPPLPQRVLRPRLPIQMAEPEAEIRDIPRSRTRVRFAPSVTMQTRQSTRGGRERDALPVNLREPTPGPNASRTDDVRPRRPGRPPKQPSSQNQVTRLEVDVNKAKLPSRTLPLPDPRAKLIKTEASASKPHVFKPRSGEQSAKANKPFTFETSTSRPPGPAHGSGERGADGSKPKVLGSRGQKSGAERPRWK